MLIRTQDKSNLGDIIKNYGFEVDDGGCFCRSCAEEKEEQGAEIIKHKYDYWLENQCGARMDVEK